MRSFSLVQLTPFLVGIQSVLATPPSEYKKELLHSNWATFPTGWRYDTGHSYSGGPANWGTGEIQEYTISSDNIAVNSAGNLVITPIKKSDGTWTSARIETAPEYDFACPSGGKLWVEGSIKVGANPSSQSMGIWPAFWLLGSPYRGNYWNWPQIGELDIMETANGYTKVWQTLHCGTSTGGPCSETNGIGTSGTMTRGAFHTLAVEVDRTSSDWKSQFVRYLVDGVERLRVTGATVGTQDYWTPVVSNSKFLLLNVAVGGGFPDGVGGASTPNSATIGGSGASMEVAYVAAYST